MTPGAAGGRVTQPVDILTKRQREILSTMAANVDNEEGELVYESGVAYLGHERVAPRTLFALLRLCALRDIGEAGSLERYTINETGLKLLRGDLSDLRLISAARMKAKLASPPEAPPA